MDNIYDEIERLTSAIEKKPTAGMYIARGKAYWSLGLQRKAINDYLAAHALEPDGEAARILEITNRILDYRNTDLLNP